jgi:hypothetical protein
LWGDRLQNGFKQEGEKPMSSWPKIPKLLVAATAFCALTAAATFTAQADKGDKGGKGDKGSKGAPGPIAGAGLPVLLVAGGYVLVRRYRNRGKADQLLPIPASNSGA